MNTNFSARTLGPAAGALAAALLLAPQAWATPYSFAAVGDSATISFNGLIDGSLVAGLSAESTFTLSSIGASSFVFAVTLANDTDATIWQSSRVRSIGFNADPNVTDATASGGNWDADFFTGHPSTQINFPGFGNVEVCVKATSTGQCTGGSEGPTIGQSDSFSLTLSFASLPTQVVLDNFVVRYQSLDSTTLNVSGGSGIGVPRKPPHQVPEPATLGLMAFAVLVIGFSVRRRQHGRAH